MNYCAFELNLPFFKSIAFGKEIPCILHLIDHNYLANRNAALINIFELVVVDYIFN